MENEGSNRSFFGTCKSAGHRIAVWGLLALGFLIICVALPMAAFIL